MARSLALGFRRIQFTPDLLPSDVTGVSIYNQKTTEFDFKQGPVFTNILLADEINRATPRTQSSMLECMAEYQVTADGRTYELPRIFMVIATQNPIELQGTYPLPEAQLDRFFMRISVGHPTIDEEMRIMSMQAHEHPIERVSAVLKETDVLAAMEAVKSIHLNSAVQRYVAEIVAATRRHGDVKLGASPRGSLALMRAAQAMALLRGTHFVDPAFVKAVVPPVLAHRLLIKPQALLAGKTPDNILDDVLAGLTVPVKAA
jgi:MoxR-like ATPase